MRAGDPVLQPRLGHDLAYVLAVALAGRPAWATALAGLGLVVVWLAPLLQAHARHPAVQPAAVPAPAMVPGEAV